MISSTALVMRPPDRASKATSAVPPQAGPGPHQPHPQRARRHAEHARCLPGRQAGEVDQLHHGPVGPGQRGQLADQMPAGPLGVDPVEQLLDLVGVQLPAARQAHRLLALPGAGRTVRRVDAPGDAEDPGARGALARVKGGVGGDHLDEGVRREIGDGVRIGAAAGELRASVAVLGSGRVVHLGYADSGRGPELQPDPPGRTRFARTNTEEAASGWPS
nr:hypothetical protein [Kitasatospora acidiphila]